MAASCANSRLSLPIAACGVSNISLDTLDDRKFAEVTRWGKLAQVMDGIDAAQEAGLRVKLNAVALKGFNEAEAVHPLTEFCCAPPRHGPDLDRGHAHGRSGATRTGWTSIGRCRDLRKRLAERYTAERSGRQRSGGPARYVRLEETGQKKSALSRRLRIISAKAANRVRLTCTGELYMCLGQEDMADLRAPLAGPAPK